MRTTTVVEKVLKSFGKVFVVDDHFNIPVFALGVRKTPNKEHVGLEKTNKRGKMGRAMSETIDLRTRNVT